MKEINATIRTRQQLIFRIITAAQTAIIRKSKRSANRHELLKKADGSAIEYFPAHPHEGGVGKPDDDDSARVIAKSKSRTTGKDFNLIVAFERSEDKHGNTLGRGIAESSFHHLVDYNWDLSKGCPTFLEEPPGNEIKNNPEKLEDVKTYVANLARWLAPIK